MKQEKALPLSWGNIGLLSLVHVAAVGGLALYLAFHGLSLAAAVIGVAFTAVTIFSISAGYHRLFSHRAYEAHPVLRLFLLIFGAGAFQNSVLVWAADHRRHHGHTDDELDPYNARRGFWYSHLGWVLRQTDPTIPVASVRDLERDPLIAWQHKYYGFIGIGAGLVLPALIGLACGDLLGGFVVGAAVRLMVCYHTTFAINSFAHMFGSQPYSDRTSARDSFFVALLSMGEGYHNFHHSFPADYRNGVGRHQYDPTKWALWVMERLGIARRLKRTSVPNMVRASLRMDEKRLQGLAVPVEARAHLDLLRHARQRAADHFGALADRYAEAKARGSARSRQVLRQLRVDLKLAQRQLEHAGEAWRGKLRASLAAVPAGH